MCGVRACAVAMRSSSKTRDTSVFVSESGFATLPVTHTMAQAITSIVRDAQVEAARVPPQSIEAEQSVLGGLLLDNQAWDKIADVLGEGDFYRSDHRYIFTHIAKLIEENKPADVLTVSEILERGGKLAEVGGQSYIGSLALNTPSAANIRRYAEIVRERSILRTLATVGTEIAESA